MNSLMFRRLSFLAPNSHTQVSSQRALRRGPPKFLGRTKTQYLDMLMRSNANICAAISLSFFPIAAYFTWRYLYVLKPEREAVVAKQNEDLLSEGKASA